MSISASTQTLKCTPGPRGYPVLGLLPMAWKNPLHFLHEAARQYGDVVSLRLGVHRVYLLSHPEHIKRVLHDNSRNYRKPTRVEKIKALFGEGLTLSDGNLWRRQRQLVEPAFHPQRIASLVTDMTEEIQTMLNRWRPLAPRGQAIDIAAEMMELAQNIALKTLFNTDLGGEADAVRHALTIALEHVNHRAWAFLDLIEHVPTPRNLRFWKALRTLDNVVYRMIAEYRQTGKDTGDLLSMLMRTRDEETGTGMSEREVRDQVMTLFVAGHEPTATALAWTWYLLLRHPGVEQQLRTEVTTVLGGRVPTSQDLPKLTYTRMVIDEAMRLYPPTWITARTPIQDDEIGGYHVPADSVVLLSPYVTHRHPAYWEEPDVFDPTRFTPDRVAGRPRYAYFPFGGGPRMCMGKNFALMEALLIVAMIAQSYRLHLVPGHPVEPRPMIALKPRYGVVVTVEEQPVQQ